MKRSPSAFAILVALLVVLSGGVVTASAQTIGTCELTTQPGGVSYSIEGSGATTESPVQLDLLNVDTEEMRSATLSQDGSGSFIGLESGTYTMTWQNLGDTSLSGDCGTVSVVDEVDDDVPPELTIPGPITTTATSGSGAVVEFVASAADDVDGPVDVKCVPNSGWTFPVGATTVHCAAIDSALNLVRETFVITVEFGGLDAIINDVEDASNSAGTKAERDLQKALRDLNRAQRELIEVPPDTDKAMKRLERGAEHIDRAVRDGFTVEEATSLNRAIAVVARSLATDLVTAAIEREGDPGDIEDALEFIADGDVEVADGEFERAIRDYARATREALRA